MRSVCQVDVTAMIYDLSVDVLRHALVEATVGGLHMEDRHLVLLLADTNISLARVLQLASISH